MSTDCELLELAAKAAGIDGHYADIHPELGDEWEESGIWYNNSNDCTDCWNPLEYDGDVLRLAVQLELDILQDSSSVTVKKWFPAAADSIELACEQIGGRRLEATRRAVTRAAAEMIGRAML